MPTINYTYLPQYEPGTFHPAFDPTGSLPANRVTGEVHTITAANARDFHFIVPLFAPFFAADLQLVYEPPSGPTRTLVEGVDYLLAFEFIGASRGCSRPVYGGISLLNTSLAGKIRLVQYRTLGGNWCLNLPQITQILANAVVNPRVTAWEQVTNYPTLFPVIDHEWNLVDMVGMSGVVGALGEIANAIAARPAPIIPVDFIQHLNDYNNPHQTTKAQVGLSLANNFATATVAQALAGTATNLHTTPQGVKALIDQSQLDVTLALDGHIGDTANPHQVTKTQVGLSNIQNYPVASQAEAQAHVAADRYMTPQRVWDELLFGFGAQLNATLGTVTVGGNLTVGGKILAAQGGGTAGGFAFNEIGQDTGIFSPGDNYMDFYSSGLQMMRIAAGDDRIQMFRPVLGATRSMVMAAGDGSNNGSLTLRADGSGDGNLAGMAFHNNNYAIKMGVRQDGYFGLGGWSRAAWSMYSDPAGNLTAAGNVIAYSDPRLKENVRPIKGASALLRKLEGFYFTWKHGIEHVAAKAGMEDMGLMADGVKKVFPQMVYKSISLDGVSYDMVAYEKMVPVLVMGQNEHDVRIETLENKLEAALKLVATRDRVIEQLHARFDALQRKVDSLID